MGATRDTATILARWVAMVGGLGLLCYVVFSYHRLPDADRVLIVDTAQFRASESATPPADASAPWEKRELPDDWYHSRVRSRNAWYRIPLALNVPPDRLWGIYLPSVSMNAAVFLNGELLGHGGRFTEPVARNWNRPLYFSIPNGLLAPGENLFHVRVKGDPPVNGLLSKIYLGPASVLEPAFTQRRFVKYSLPQFIIIGLLVMSAFMAFLWMRRRDDTLYGWFALSMLVWGVHTFNIVVANVPVPTYWWDWAMHLTVLWLAIVATCFIHRFLGVRRPRRERALHGYGAALTIAAAIVSAEWFYPLGVRVVITSALLLGAYPVVLLLVHFWRNARLDILLLMMSGMFMVVLGTHDMLAGNYLISREDGFLLHYSAPLAIALFTSILLRRFVDALNDSETLNLELEQRIEDKRRELERSYDEMRQLEQRRVLMEERERIMRDMHDGIGGHLVSTLALVEGSDASHPGVREALQLALDDLRLIIDSMDDEVGGNLHTLLAMVRERIEPRLEQAGIEMRWQLDPVPQLPQLSPQRALQIMRIVQEAITNTLKHAEARQVIVATGRTLGPQGAECVYIELRDDGKGIAAGATTTGRGLRNLHRRAALLGAQLEISSAEPGTRVRLSLPLAGAN